MELEELRDKIKLLMKDSRYQHCLGTEAVACDLALIYGCDIKKASIASVLHDCARELSYKELLIECIRYNIPVTEIERQSPYLLHAKVGEAYARDKFEVEDDDILNAIRYHTTGRPGMSLLEKIIYTADYIEPGRMPLPDIDRIRFEAYNHLDVAIAMIADNTLYYLSNTGAVIDDLTAETEHYYNGLIKI